MILLFQWKRENDFTICAGREYDFDMFLYVEGVETVCLLTHN